MGTSPVENVQVACVLINRSGPWKLKFYNKKIGTKLNFWNCQKRPEIQFRLIEDSDLSVIDQGLNESRGFN